MLTKATVRGLACEYGVCNRYAGVTVLQRNRLKNGNLGRCVTAWVQNWPVAPP